MTLPAEQIKAAKRRDERAARLAFLERRVDELHKTGDFPGVLARRQADREWAERER